MKCHFKFFVGSVITMETLIVITMIREFRNFDIVAKLIPQVIAILLCFYKVFSVLSNEKLVQNTTEILKINFPSSFADQKKLKIKKSLTKFKKIYWTISFPGIATCASFILALIKNMVVNQSWVQKLPLDIWFPFDAYDPKFYTFVIIWINWFYPAMFFAIVGSDLTIYMFITLISIQSDEICNKLKKLNKFSTNEQQKEVKIILKSHNDLIKCSENLERIFSPSLVTNFIGSSMMLCLVTFQITNGNFEDAVKYTMLLSSNLAQILVLCFHGSKLIESSEKITEAVYDSEWNEINDKKVKHMALLMMIRSQKPCVLTAAKFATISLKVFSSVS